MDFLTFRLFFISVLALLSSCDPCPSVPPGALGYSESRRLVVAGENVKPEIAAYYGKEYQGQVWSTPYRGRVANATDNLLESGIGPSRSMRSLVGELQSINHTFGRWEIIVPKMGEKYFFNTLKNMRTSSLAKARGMVVLTENSNFPGMEREVQRVSDGNSFVMYESQKDLKK